MTCYAYFHLDSLDGYEGEAHIYEYAARQAINVDTVVSEKGSIKTHWTNRTIGELIGKLEHRDVLIVPDATQLACSTSQVLEILSTIHRNGASICFAKYGVCMENAEKDIDTQLVLSLVAKIESDFISKRTMQALAKRKAAGLPLGRPKGRGNKSLKLDKHQDDIVKYIGLGISKASIAKLVGCHPQTLYDWLDRQDAEVLSKSTESSN